MADRLLLLDSLAHPTISGSWLDCQEPADFEHLSTQLERADFVGACAIGLDGVEGYSHETFAERCRAHPQLIPVAGFNPERDSTLAAMMKLKRLGFRGIKIHPRFSKLTRSMHTLVPVFRNAAQADLPVFLCTYFHCSIHHYPLQDPFTSLVGLLADSPETRVVLVHGGDVQLMRYAELVRFNDNLLLDLSLTIMKYQGSSIDLDLQFLFHSFDRRICVGTDWPEYSPEQLRKRFESFSAGLTDEKKRNIAHRNLLTFLGVDGHHDPAFAACR